MCMTKSEAIEQIEAYIITANAYVHGGNITIPYLEDTNSKILTALAVLKNDTGDSPIVKAMKDVNMNCENAGVVYVAYGGRNIWWNGKQFVVAISGQAIDYYFCGLTKEEAELWVSESPLTHYYTELEIKKLSA